MSIVGVEIIKVQLTSKGAIEVTYRKPSGSVLVGIVAETVPDTVWKDVYYAKDGKIYKGEKIYAKYIPSVHIPEKFIF